MSKWYLPLAVLLCSAWALFLHRDELRDRNVFYGDSSYYYVLYGYADASLLKKDFLMSYLRELEGKEKVSLVPRPLLPLERRMVRFAGPREILLWKAILGQMLICILTVFLLRLRYGAAAAWALPLFVLYFSTTDVFFGGLHREFGAAALLLLYFGMLRNSRALLAASLVAFAMFYWVSLPLALAVLAAWRWREKIFAGPAGVAVYAAGTAAISLSGIYLLQWLFPDYMAGALQALSWKDQGAGGFLGFVQAYLLNSFEHVGPYTWITCCLAACAAAGWWGGQRILGEEEKPLALAAGVIFISVALYSPSLASRQIVHVFPLLVLLAFVNLLYALRIRQLCWAAVAALLCAFLVAGGGEAGLHRVNPETNAAIEAATAEGDLVFAHPYEEALGLYTRRAVYAWVMTDSLVCANGPRAKCEEAAQRLDSALRVYYTGSREELADFIRSSGVDHFLVHERYYVPDLSVFPQTEERINLAAARYYSAAARHVLRETAMKHGAKIGEGVYLLPARKALEALVPHGKRPVAGT